jgi:GNAT superfamily N-acetyltransferase
VNAFQLAPFDATRREDYLRLLRDAWGDGALSGAEFDWWFDGNPAGSLRTVALRDGRVVGVHGHSLYRARLGGRDALVATSVHASTDPSARGLGIFRELERRHEQEGEARGVACVLAFASAPTEPLFLGPLGWNALDRRRVWARPFPGLRGSEPQSPVRPLAEPGPAQNAAYAAAAARLGNHIVRDATYLRWRYLESPRDYRAFASPNGFAVLGRKRHRGRPVGVVADCVAPPREARALLRRCIAEARGAQAVFVVPPVGLPRGALLSLGFVPTPITLHFMGKELAGPFPRSGWTVSLGDTDFF